MVSLSTGSAGSPPFSPPIGPDTRLIINTNVLTIDLSTSSLDFETEYWVYISESALEVDGIAWNQLLAIPGEWSFTTEAAPFTLDILLPEDGASNVALDASLVATFNQNIQLGASAEVHIYDYATETLFETVDVGLSVSGADLIINPTSDLTEGAHYYVVISADAVETISGAPFAGLSDKDAWDFTTIYLPLENPVLTPNAVVVLKNPVLSLVFDKNIELGSGTIGIYNGSTQEKLFDASSSAVSIVNNNTLQIDLSNNALAQYGTVYDVRIASTLIKRVGAEVYFGGFDAGEWSFTTEAAPFTIDLQVPEDGASNVALDANLVATFNQNIQLGANPKVHIYDYQSESVVETITTGLSVSGSVLIIDPTADLTEGTHYYVVIPAGAVKTTSGAPFAGLTDKDAWDFTTAYLPLENPVLSPAHNAVGILKDAVLSLEFDVDIELVTGNIEIYSGGNEIMVFTKNSSSVSIINNNTLLIDLSSNPLAEYGTVYDVRIASTLIKRVGAEVYFGGFGQGEWSFTTEVQPDPLLMKTSSLSPADGSVEVPRAPTLEVTFDQEITWGPSGVLTVHRYDNDATAATISREQTGASISQDQLSIVFSAASLKYGTKYYVVIDEGFVKALNTSAVFAGLSDKEVWTFTTETAPPVWAEGYPFIDQQDASKLNLNVLADQTGIVYAVITSNPVAPSAAQIALGQNAVGKNALVSANGSVASTITPAVLTVNFDTSVPLGTVYFLHTVLKNDDGKYSDVESLAVDRVVPKINEGETYPEDRYTNMGVSEDIVIVFSEPVFGADGLELTSSSFSLNLVEGTPTPVRVDFSVSSTSERTTVTLNPVDDLAPITDYTITIQSVYDASGNASGEITWGFQTDGIFTWTGAGKYNDWSHPDNWSGSYVSGKSVVISGAATAFPIVEEGDVVSVHNLTIEPTAVLTQKGGTINVSGEFHLLSSADRNASYLPKGGVLNVEGADVDKVFVHQVIPIPTSPEVFVFVMGSPTWQADALNTGSGFQMRWYDNTTDTWNNNNLNLMVPGVGYSVSANNDLVFRGEINRSSVQAQVTRTDGQGFGWNVLGNPFTAALDWSSIMNEAENEGITTLLENNFWVWDPSQSLYKAFNQETGVGIDMDGTIPSNHGFIVKVNIGETGGEFDLKPSFLVNNKGNYLKSSSIVPDHVKISAGNERFKDKLAVVFIDEASDGVDKYDTEKRFGSGVNPFEIFTVSSSNKLTINSFPFENGKAVGLGYSASAAGEYTIEMSDYVTEGVEVLLIDNEYDLSTNLTEGDSYSFSIETKGVNTTRFSLIFSGALTTGVVSYPAEDLSYCKVYVDNGEVFVEVPNQWLGSRFKVTDISGRSVKEGEFATEGVNVVGAFGSGVHILSITSPSGEVRTQKIVVY